MNEEEIVLVGKVGLGISVALWVLTTWRLGFHFCGGRLGCSNHEGEDERRRYRLSSQDSDPSGPLEQQQRRRRRQRPASWCRTHCARWCTRRRAFHGLLWIAASCEIVSYANLSGIRQIASDRILAESAGLFLLNAIGRNLELLAFGVATETWLRTATDARPRSTRSGIRSLGFWLDRSTRAFVRSTTALVLVSACSSIVDFCRFPRAPYRKVGWAVPLREFQTVVEASCWGIHASMVLLGIGMTSGCVLALVPSTERKRRLFLLSKTVGPMLVSFLAYATRCGWLIAASVDQSRRDGWAWWIGFVWVPSATASIVLLYSLRKRDYDIENIAAATEEDDDDSNAIGSNDGDLEESLLRPQPPEEAFRAFHSFRNGEEDIDDSFSLGSPAPQYIS